MAFIDDIKLEIKDRLPDWLGSEVYVCDLGFLLTKSENKDGVWLDDPQTFIAENWQECKEFFDYYKSDFGEALNPFENGGHKFTVVMLITAVESVFAQAIQDSTEYDWNSEIVVDDDFIDEVISGLDQVTEIW